jgi:phosphoribosyl-AMP cyclohydrolase
MSTILFLACLLAVGHSTTTGIWYSTWYANHGNYLWIAGHGVGSSQQFLADVNGDGMDDAIVYFSDGSWYVSLSTGSHFNNYSPWGSFGKSTQKQFLADVNGDGKSDVIAYINGTWSVALSNGNKFIPNGTWIAGHGVGSSEQLIGDVNGDGKADAVVIFLATNDWYVSLSSGSSFIPYSKWISGGTSGNVHLLADVNGDKKLDAIDVSMAGSTKWNVALSTGSSFQSWSVWLNTFGFDTTTVTAADTNGDGKADAVTINSATGNWYLCASNGASFPCDHQSLLWKSGHKPDATFNGLGNVFGNGHYAPVSYITNSGSWFVIPADPYYFKPNMWNTWQAWNLGAVPYVGGRFRQYDSSEIDVIDEHISALQSIGVKFLLFDETNFLHVDGNYIFERAQGICQRIATLTELGKTNIKYAVAIGGMQFNSDPTVMEQEAGEVWTAFVNNPKCGGTKTFFSLDNVKPVLASYASWKQRQIWEV